LCLPITLEKVQRRCQGRGALASAPRWETGNRVARTSL